MVKSRAASFVLGNKELGKIKFRRSCGPRLWDLGPMRPRGGAHGETNVTVGASVDLANVETMREVDYQLLCFRVTSPDVRRG
jgi:hypothetical protein